MINKIKLKAFLRKEDAKKPDAHPDCIVHCEGYNQAGYHLFEWLSQHPDGVIEVERPDEPVKEGKPYAK